MTSEQLWNEYNAQVKFLQVQECAGLLSGSDYHEIVTKLFALLVLALNN